MQEIERHKITVEFCKNCKLHSWCTNHSEEKYKEAFDDLCRHIKAEFSHVDVIANEPPQHYVPIKVKENKFFDTESKKYVLFPAIGAFEIYFNEKLLFSKKTTNNWPNYEELINEIVFLLTGERRVPQKEDEHPETEDSRISSKTVLYSTAKSNSTVVTKKRISNKNLQEENLELLYAEYETINNGTISKITKEDIEKLHGLWGKKDMLPNFIKNKAYIQETKGKKEMLVNLSSIEEESELKENQISAPNSQKKKLPNLEKDFDRLENKFKKLETRFSAVNNKRFDMESEYNSKQFSESKSRTSDNLTKFSTHDKVNESRISHSPERMLKEMKDKKQKRIEKYINSTPEEKHEQLGIIYGAQYINYNLSSAQPSQRKNFNKLGKIKESLEDFSEGCDEDSNTDIFAPLKRDDGGSFYTSSQKQFSKTQNSFKPSVEKRKIYTREKLTSTPIDSQNDLQKMKNKLKGVDQSQSVLYHVENNKVDKNKGVFNGKSGEKGEEKNNRNFNGISQKENKSFEKQRIHGNIADSKKKNELKKISQKNVRNNEKKNSLEETEKIYMAESNQNYERLSYHNSKSVSQSKGPKRKQFDAKNKNASKNAKNQSDSYSEGSNEQDSEAETNNNNPKSHSKEISNVNENKSKYHINQEKFSQKSKSKMDANSKRGEESFSKRSLNQSYITKKEHLSSKNRNASFQKSDRSQDFNNNESQLTKKMSATGPNKSKSKNFAENNQRLSSRSASVNHSFSAPRKLKEKNDGFATDRKSNKSGYEKHWMKNGVKVVNENILTSRSKQSSSELKNKSNIHSSRSQVFEKNKSSLSLRSNKSKSKQISHRLKKGDQVSEKLSSPKSYEDELNHIQENKSEFVEEDYETQKNSRSERVVEKEMIEHQMNNIGTEAKPKRIYEIDEEIPDMVDVSTQKDDEYRERNKIGHGMQTSNLNEHRDLEIEKESENKEEDNKISYDSILKENKSKINLPNEVELKEHNNQISSENTKIEENKSFSKSNSNYQSKSHISYKKRINIEYKSAAIVKILYGQHYKAKAQEIEKIMKESFSHSKTEKRVCDLYGGNSNIFDLDSISFDKIVDVENKLGNIIKIIKILCMKNEYLIIRLFENPEIPDAPIFGVWLCENYNWKCFLIDSEIKSKENKTPLYFAHEGHQLWPTILVEALLKKYQTIENLSSISVSELFHTLTGSNFINFRIKEDPEKNSKLLKFITANEKKNFIILAQKRMHHSLGECIEQESENTVYLILSQKIINNKEVLLRMKKDNSDPFWIKFDKFTTEFSQIDILQLRINHNFNQLNLEQCGNGLFKVIELQFNDQSFGCVAFASENKESNFKIHVYKEEDDNVLRLVGQVKEKNKSFTFFDCCFEEGKYIIFADMKSHNNRVSYMGEGFPLLNIKEEIKEIGLKNNYTEYIPIEAMPKRQEQEMPRFLNMTKRSENDGIFGIESEANSQKMRIDKEKLKSQFIEFLTSN